MKSPTVCFPHTGIYPYLLDALLEWNINNLNKIVTIKKKLKAMDL